MAQKKKGGTSHQRHQVEIAAAANLADATAANHADAALLALADAAAAHHADAAAANHVHAAAANHVHADPAGLAEDGAANHVNAAPARVAEEGAADHAEDVDAGGGTYPAALTKYNSNNIAAIDSSGNYAAIPKKLAPTKKRKDDGWADGYRAKRALLSRDSKIYKLQQQNQALQQQTNKAEQGWKTAEQEKKAAVAGHHREKKISRELSLKQEKDYKSDLQELQQTHEDELSSAFALLGQATQKELVSEAAKIVSEQKQSAERDKYEAAKIVAEQKVGKERDKSSQNLATAAKKYKKKLGKEKRGHLGAMTHLEKRWKKKMDDAIQQLRLNQKEDEKKMKLKLQDKDSEIEKDRKKNQYK